MKISRRKVFLAIWLVSLVLAGVFVHNASYGIATSLSLLAISLGVPLMRAFTEFSK